MTAQRSDQAGPGWPAALVHPGLPSDDSSHGRYIWWIDHQQRTHWIALADARPVLEPLTGGDHVAVGDGDVTLEDRMATAFESRALRGGVYLRNLMQLVAWFTMMFILVGAPTRTASRWFWIWVGFLPLGLGIFAFCWVELVRGCAPRRFHGGGQGFLVMVIGSPFIHQFLARLS